MKDTHGRITSDFLRQLREQLRNFVQSEFFVMVPVEFLKHSTPIDI